MSHVAPVLPVRPPGPDAIGAPEPVETTPGEAPPGETSGCASCGTPLAGPYCHACGEKRLDRHDYALAHVVEHGIDAFTHFDVKVLRSLWSLFRRPGLMPADVLDGRRVRWARPFQLFIVANVLYFLVASAFGLNTFQTPLRHHYGTFYGDFARTVATGKAAALGLTAEAYAARFDAQAHTLSKTLLILLVPFVALVLHGMHVGHRRYYLEHLTVALTLVPALLLLTPLMLPFVLAALALGGPTGGSGDAWWTVLSLGAFTAYVTVFLRRPYGGGLALRLVRAVGMSFAWYLILLFVYRPILFLAAQVLTQR